MKSLAVVGQTGRWVFMKVKVSDFCFRLFWLRWRPHTLKFMRALSYRRLGHVTISIWPAKISSIKPLPRLPLLRCWMSFSPAWKTKWWVVAVISCWGQEAIVPCCDDTWCCVKIPWYLVKIHYHFKVYPFFPWILYTPFLFLLIGRESTMAFEICIQNFLWICWKNLFLFQNFILFGNFLSKRLVYFLFLIKILGPFRLNPFFVAF